MVGPDSAFVPAAYGWRYARKIFRLVEEGNFLAG
jgi:hypothetical protein